MDWNVLRCLVRRDRAFFRGAGRLRGFIGEVFAVGALWRESGPRFLFSGPLAVPSRDARDKGVGGIIVAFIAIFHRGLHRGEDPSRRSSRASSKVFIWKAWTRRSVSSSGSRRGSSSSVSSFSSPQPAHSWTSRTSWGEASSTRSSHRSSSRCGGDQVAVEIGRKCSKTSSDRKKSSPFLGEELRNGRLPASLLFSGPEYSGKLTSALELARALSCDKPVGLLELRMQVL